MFTLHFTRLRKCRFCYYLQFAHQVWLVYLQSWTGGRDASCVRLYALHAVDLDCKEYMYVCLTYGSLFIVFVALQPNSGLDRLIVEVSRSHTIRHTHAPDRTPLMNEWSARYRGRYLLNTQETDIHALSGIRTPDPSNYATALESTTTGIGYLLNGHFFLVKENISAGYISIAASSTRSCTF
jgi:hypothetical protein